MKTHIKNIPQNLKINRVILEFEVQISLNQRSYLVRADEQQPWERQEHPFPGLLRDALLPLHAERMVPEQSLKPHGPQITHARDS